jgi:hypothetical protein
MNHIIFAGVACAITAPVSAATLVGPYPFAAGDIFTFSYQSTDSVTKTSGKPVVTTQSYTETTTIMPPVNYAFPPSGGTVTAYPVETRATSTGSAGALTLKLIEYRNFVPSASGTNYVIYGYSDVSDLVESPTIALHESTVRVYDTPFVLDQLPETTAAGWSEPIAWKETVDNEYVTSQGGSNVLQSKFFGMANGSYTDSGMSYDVPYAVVQKANGTGTLTEGPSDAEEAWNFGLPKTSASGEIIPVIVSFAGKTGANSVPDWFPGNGAPPVPLTTQAMVDQGVRKIPAGCGAYAGRNARLLALTYAQLAPVSGYTIDETDDYFVIAKIGRACQTTKFTRTDYDSQVKGAVTSVETFSSTLGLMKERVK